MPAAALIVAILALIVSTVSVVYTHRQTRATEHQAEVARNQDRRERRPNITVRLDEAVSAPVNSAVYYVRNHGPQDLDSVVVHRPQVEGGVRYPVARSGTDYGDDAELGPLRLGQEQGFVLSIGSGEELPEFTVRLECRKGGDLWPSSFALDDPRFHIGIY